MAFAQGLEEYVSLQLLLIEEESRVDLRKGERTGADVKEGPQCDKLEETTPADCCRQAVARPGAGEGLPSQHEQCLSKG